MGKVPSTGIFYAYRRMDVLVLPSRTTHKWKEQFGRVLVEAMASSTPVIGSDSGEIPNVIGDAGLVYPEGDARALAHEITRIRKDEDLHHELVAKGLERVRNYYTWTRIAEMLEHLIREVAYSVSRD
jgi:glycosyltransferase involved in cell wall biosynthesis